MRAAFLVLAGVFAALLAGTGRADAHAELVATQPASSAVVPSPPRQVTLIFAEAVTVRPDGVRVRGPDGATADNGQAVHIDGKPGTVGVPFTSTTLGTYTVSWHVLSADSHPVSGAFTFSVGHPSVAASAAPSAASAAPPAGGDRTVAILYWTARVLGYAGFALLTGSVGFVLLCWPAGSGQRRVRRLTGGGWLALLVATAADGLLQGPYGAGTGIGHVFDGGLITATMGIPLGTGLAARVSLLAVAALVINEVMTTGERTSKRRAVLSGLSVLLLGGLAWTWSMAGHAATGLNLPMDVLHLCAMGLWIGGLVVLLAAKPPASAVQRFSPLAFSCVVVLVLTGSYQTLRQLGSWTGFVDTGYGRLLLVKIAAVLGVVGAAWFSRRWVRTRAGSLKRPVLVETAGAAVVLALTAALVAEPARPAEAAPPPGSTVSTVSTGSTASTGSISDGRTIAFDAGGPNGSGKLRVTVLPATTGPNLVTITVSDAAGMRTDVAELTLELSSETSGLAPLKVDVQHVGMGQGQYRATNADIPVAGSWRLAITVRTSDFDETTVSSQFQVT